MIDWTASEAVVAAALRARGIESDLADGPLVAYASSARAEIAKRLGPVTDIVRLADGTGQRYIQLSPPVGSISEVLEEGIEITEDADGYRLRPGGGFIERLSQGYASSWRGRITITYDAAAADDRYDRVVVDLVKLALEYTGLDSRRDGDYGEESKGARGGGGQLNYQLERQLLIDELLPSDMVFA